jgi:uncharacterized protein YqiB (DUF1249 family)
MLLPLLGAELGPLQRFVLQQATVIPVWLPLTGVQDGAQNLTVVAANPVTLSVDVMQKLHPATTEPPPTTSV